MPVDLRTWEGDLWASVHPTVPCPDSGHTVPHCACSLDVGIELSPFTIVFPLPSPLCFQASVAPYSHDLDMAFGALTNWPQGALQPSASPAELSLSLAPFLNAYMVLAYAFHS